MTVKRILRWPVCLLLIFSVAILLRVFLIELYRIPSDSMNGCLYQGDVILVSKVGYGAVLPRSLVDIPFVPVLMLIKPLNKWLVKDRWDFGRMPGLTQVKTGDVVVFRFPNEKELCIKRCVAGPGDTLRIEHDVVFINGQSQRFPDSARLSYLLKTTNNRYDEQVLKWIPGKDPLLKKTMNGLVVSLTQEEQCRLRERQEVQSLRQTEDTLTLRCRDFFLYKPGMKWNSSTYGPVVIPGKGLTIRLDTTNLVVYHHIIREEVNQAFYILRGRIYIEGREVHMYTFKKDYYFMMGDHRLNSIDSRFKGFVPVDRVVGKASLVLFSQQKDSCLNKSFRPNRWMVWIK